VGHQEAAVEGLVKSGKAVAREVEDGVVGELVADGLFGSTITVEDFVLGKVLTGSGDFGVGVGQWIDGDGLGFVHGEEAVGGDADGGLAGS
jgi:hypothetical protein